MLVNIKKYQQIAMHFVKGKNNKLSNFFSGKVKK